MSDAGVGFALELKCRGDCVRLPIPARVFATAAEQLRWDALRAGRIDIEGWRKAGAYVGPRCADGGEPVRQFALTVVGAGEPIDRYCEPARLQGLTLFIERQLSRSDGGDECLHEIRWTGRTGGERRQPIPLAPRRLPLAELPASWRPSSTEGTPALLVDGSAQAALEAMGEETLRLRKELGACLIGRVEDPDTLHVEETIEAPSADASAGHFRFDRHFWVELGNRLEKRRDHRLLGWAHTHLIDHGAPKTLSIVDLTTAHRCFSSPWSVAALVCASSSTSETRWFGWQGGNLTERKASVCESGPAAGK